MKQHITVITIGVDDLEKSLAFYRDGLGFKTEGIVGQEFEYGAVAFIEMQKGLKLGLWPRKNLAHDTGLSVSPVSSTEFLLGHNVPSKEAEKAGATIVKQAQDTFWGGYAGYFKDLDEHLWEISME
ncbi:MAG: VOC family protein [Nitrosomonas sp.]|nr:VOC family protein [Nitrosomonas sp.]MCW5608628.1 VOC family protein [Nitrosomonas sp.]